MPRRLTPFVWGMLAVTLAPLSLWLTGRATLWGDMVAGGMPILSLLHQMAQQGELFSWSPYAGCGMPTAAEGQGLLFYPGNWLFLVLQPLKHLMVGLWIHHLLAYAGAYRFFRTLRFRTGVAALGGLCYAHSAPLVLYSHDLAYWGILALLPWIMAEIEIYLAGRSWRGLARLTALLSLPILSGGWQLVLWGYVFAILYALVAARQRLRLVADMAMTAVLALLIAGVAIVPLLQVQAAGAARGTPLSLAEATYNSVEPLFLPLWLDVNFFGNLHGLAQKAGYLANEQVYVPGVVPLALTLLGLARARPAWRRRLWLMLGISGLLGCLALGRHSPLYLWCFEHISWFASLRVPARCLVAIPLLWSLGVCAGLDASFRLRHKPWAVAGGLGLFYVFFGVFGQTGWWSAHLIWLGAALGLLLVFWPGHSWRMPAAAVAVVLTGWSFWLHVNDYMFVPSDAPAMLLAPILEEKRGLSGPYQRILLTEIPELLVCTGGYGSASISPFLSRGLVQLQFMAITGHAMSEQEWARFHHTYPKEIFKIPEGKLNPALFQLLGVERIFFKEGVFRLGKTGAALLVQLDLQAGRPDQMASELLATPFDASTTVLLIDEGLAVAEPPFSRATPRFVEYGNDRVRIDVAGGSGWLTLSDLDSPGWVARVDGIERPHYRGYGEFRSLPIYPGERVVEYTYTAPGLRGALLVSLGACLMTGLLYGRGSSVRE